LGIGGAGDCICDARGGGTVGDFPVDDGIDRQVKLKLRVKIRERRKAERRMGRKLEKDNAKAAE